MKLKIGILMIGSLYWADDSVRKKWRKNRLLNDEEYDVSVPIRYGRQSRKRDNTFTMVFSSLCYRRSHGLGSAKVIHCKQLIKNTDQLIAEAEHLWAAEDNKPEPTGEISANWGRITLLVNPNNKASKDISKAWQERVSRENQYENYSTSRAEKSTVLSDGSLNITWPTMSSGKPLHTDLLLATATKPTLRAYPPVYPRIREIAQAWKKDTNGRDEYFWKNKKYGITTYQDQAIERLLTQKDV